MVDKKLLDTVLALAKSQKEAYAPPPSAMPPDPSQMGGMPPAPVPGMPAAGAMPPTPPDPSQMGMPPAGAMPPDPSQMGMPPGDMPMDPNAMGGQMPPDPSQMGAPGGSVPIMMSTEDLMSLVQMAASSMQSGGQPEGQPGVPDVPGTGDDGPGSSDRVTNKKVLSVLEDRLSGVEDMLAQVLNAMGIQVPEKQVPMPEMSPETVAGMGAGAPPPAGAMPGGMPEPMPTSDMGPMASPPMGMKTASQHGTHPLSEAMRRMRLINGYKE